MPSGMLRQDLRQRLRTTTRGIAATGAFIAVVLTVLGVRAVI